MNKVAKLIAQILKYAIILNIQGSNGITLVDEGSPVTNQFVVVTAEGQAYKVTVEAI